MIDLFEKCYKPGIADEARALGIYPYFHALESKQDVTVIMEGKRRIMLGTYVLSSGYYDAYYKKAKFTQKLMQGMFQEAFQKADLILCPTAPDTAFKFGENSDDQVKMYMNDILTVTVNITGLPALSFPCGFDGKGLPVGCQLIGDKFSEQQLLNTAYAYEKAMGGFDLSKTLD